jgi:hypothetical protein
MHCRSLPELRSALPPSTAQHNGNSYHTILILLFCYLLHMHRRSLPELRSALLPAFMDRLPHLFDIYKVDPNSGVQEILTSSKISWSSETVIEDAATPEHRQYIDWLCGHLAAILRGCFQRQ